MTSRRADEYSSFLMDEYLSLLVTDLYSSCLRVVYSSDAWLFFLTGVAFCLFNTGGSFRSECLMGRSCTHKFPIQAFWQ